MKTTQRITGEKLVNVFLLCISIFYLGYTIANYKLGSMRMPKEGTMPLILGIGMVFLSAILTIQALLGKGDAKDVRMAIEWWRFLSIIAASLLYVLLMQPLGYMLSTFLFLFALLKLSKLEGILKPLIISAVAAASFTLVFRIGLGVMLPTGFLGL